MKIVNRWRCPYLHRRFYTNTSNGICDKFHDNTVSLFHEASRITISIDRIYGLDEKHYLNPGLVHIPLNIKI